MIDINKPIKAVVSSLTDSKRFNEFEASRIAVDAKRGYSNWKRFELARKQEADNQIALAAKSLGFI